MHTYYTTDKLSFNTVYSLGLQKLLEFLWDGCQVKEARINTLTSNIASMGPMKAYLRPSFSGNQQLQKYENS